VSRFTYTEEMLDFLREGCRSMMGDELTVAFNARFGTDKSESAIHSARGKHGIKCGRGRGVMKGKRMSFTDEQVAFIREGYRRWSLDELTEEFRNTFGPIKTRDQIRGFTRNHAIRSGRTGCFGGEGFVPWNKGKKGLNMGESATRFQSGHVPANRRPLGSERLSKDGYIEIKVAEVNPHTGHATRFRLKHLHIWERVNGKVPQGMCLAFIDGNKANCTLENLELISRAENVLRNKTGFNQLPDELRPTAAAVVKLKVRTFGLLRQSTHAAPGTCRADGSDKAVAA